MKTSMGSLAEMKGVDSSTYALIWFSYSMLFSIMACISSETFLLS